MAGIFPFWYNDYQKGMIVNANTWSNKRKKKTYTSRIGAAKVEALKNVTLTAEKGEYIAIMGESGSGKTTLLNILAALDKSTGGRVMLDGTKLSKVKER